MIPQNQLRQHLNIQDVCLLRYFAGTEKKSLLATVVEIDEFSEYHPVKLVCKIDSDEIGTIQEGVYVSLVIKKKDLQLYVLLKGTVFQKKTQSDDVILSITEVHFFTKEKNNNISSFRKIKNLAMLSAA